MSTQAPVTVEVTQVLTDAAGQEYQVLSVASADERLTLDWKRVLDLYDGWMAGRVDGGRFKDEALVALGLVETIDWSTCAYPAADALPPEDLLLIARALGPLCK